MRFKCDSGNNDSETQYRLRSYSRHGDYRIGRFDLLIIPTTVTALHDVELIQQLIFEPFLVETE